MEAQDTTQLTAQELRIGNYVNTLIGKVVGQKDMCIIEINHLEHINNGNDFGYTPIPLTEKWLLKFGFIQDGKTIWYHYKDYYVGILNIEGRNIFCKDGCQPNYHGNVKHVHQLQNLYFALTNEELEIT